MTYQRNKLCYNKEKYYTIKEVTEEDVFEFVSIEDLAIKKYKQTEASFPPFVYSFSDIECNSFCFSSINWSNSCKSSALA